MKNEIMRWIAAGCNYNEGIVLLQKYGKNRQMIHQMATRYKERYHVKMKYELSKVGGLPTNEPEAIAISNDFVLNNPDLDPNEKQPTKDLTQLPEEMIKAFKTDRGIDYEEFKNLPDVIKEMAVEKGKLYSERDKLHRKLKSLAAEPGKEAQDDRADLMKQINELTVKIEILYTNVQEFRTSGQLPGNPDEEVKDPVENLTPEKTGIELIKKRNNLRSWISKTTKKISTIPDGPKKTDKSTQLAKKVKELQKIEAELNDE